MKQKFIILLLLIIKLGTLNSFGQKQDTSKMDNLVVYGENFMFSIKEPNNWHGDIDIAKDYSSNIVFYKSKEDIKNGGALIQVYGFKKQDEETEKDLEYDIKGYQTKYKKLRKRDIAISHKEYKCFAKLVYVDKDFYQYIVYVNPGPKYKFGVSIAMNISKRQATEEELKAFNEIISSLVMLK